MKSTRIDGLRIVVAIAVVVAVVAYADAQGSAVGRSVDFAKPGELQARSSRASEVELAMARTGVVSKLETALGDAFGGVWFEPTTAQLHVGVTSPASRQSAESVAAKVGLADSVTETMVDSTWAELEAVRDAWQERFVERVPRGTFAVSLVAHDNSVKVELGSDVPSSARAKLRSDAVAAPVDVSLSVVASESLHVTPYKRCAIFVEIEAYCDPTIVSGVSIATKKHSESGIGTCTAGVPLIRKNPKTAAEATETFLLTAGHCLTGEGAVTKEWFAFPKNGIPGEIGKAKAALSFPVDESSIDAGLIEISSNTWADKTKNSPLTPVIARWSKAEETDPFALVEEATPVEKTQVCYSGQRTGTQCGEIIEVEKSEVIKVEEVVVAEWIHASVVQLEGGSKAKKGDSGAPFFNKQPFEQESKGYALGTLVGGTDPEESNKVIFQRLSVQLAALAEQKGYAVELLTPANEKRHRFTAEKYPVTFSAKDTTAEDEFTAFGATIECTESEFHGVMTKAEQEEDPTVVKVTPTYKKCTGAAGVPVTATSNECMYELTLEAAVAENQYSAEPAIACPEGKAGIQFHVYASHSSLTSGTSICTLTVPPQAGLDPVTLTNSGGDIVVDAGSVEGTKVKIHRKSFACPSSGTENETTSGIYHRNKALTVSGTSEAKEVKIDIGGE
jgi:hypothetical protein